MKGLFILVPHEELKSPTFFVYGCRNIPCDVTSATIFPEKTDVFPHKDIEDSLAMGDIDENIPFKALLFIQGYGKSIYHWMEDQRCTKLACISRELFNMHSLEERLDEIPICNEYLDLKKVDDNISNISASHIVY